jgi:hypothetical protein
MNVCSKQTLDHLVGTRKQRGRHREAERLRGLEVHDQFHLAGLLHRQVGWILALAACAGAAAERHVLSALHPLGL